MTLEEFKTFALMIAFLGLAIIFGRNLFKGLDSGKMYLRGQLVKEEESPKTFEASVAFNGCYMVLAIILFFVFFVAAYRRG